MCDESRPHGVGSNEGQQSAQVENSDDQQAPRLMDDVEVSVRPGGGAVQITAQFDEPIKGFQLQYSSPSDQVYNDIQLDDIGAGTGTYTWNDDGDQKSTSEIVVENDPNGRFVTYKFKRDDNSYYELRLDVDGNTISIIFVTPNGLDDSVYSQAVQMLIQDSSTHLYVTDAAGNTSDDLLHE